MLSQWGMEDRITTNDLGNRKFLLNFTLEEDLSSVLRGMLVDVDYRKPLKFSRKVESKDGDDVTIEIKSEKLFKHCSTCGMLSHEKDHCPSSDVRSRLQVQTDRPGSLQGCKPHRI
ncbi:hypothetical protein HID58_028928 [Brassica napus]|uniref:Zinc knuckle CX2CX4HX4C domain-containing protein n=1 Tax=Brassica napus TaxID=3708 RepID=A0ABQ8CCK3_BRANA|nr:hypothetical protein HID58_028928 [Brassica napus]